MLANQLKESANFYLFVSLTFGCKKTLQKITFNFEFYIIYFTFWAKIHH
jgi:hypothetical protein